MPGAHEPLTDPLLSAEFYAGDPHVGYARLRAKAPLAWNASVGCWVASTHRDVVTASSDPATFCSSGGILVEEIGHTYDSPPTMMHTDPPEHTRYRKLVQPSFRPGVIRGLEEAVVARADALVATLAADEATDIVATLSVPFPIQVIADLLGLAGTDTEHLFRWSEAAIPGATDLSDDERMGLMGEMTVYLLELAAARRAEPRHDVVSLLAAAESPAGDGAAPLRDDELAMFLVQLVVAGNETTRNALSGGVVALAQNAEQWQRLREACRPGGADPGPLLALAVEEVLRWTSPVVSFLRTTTRDTELGGVAVAAGDPVLLVYASANRDDAEFGPTADRFDIGRDPNHHVALGFGPHFCLGAALARLELRAALHALARRFDTLELAGPVERSGSSVIAGVRRAPVVLA